MAYPDLQPKRPPMTFMQRVEVGNRLCYICALTVMVFLRRDIGYRLLNPLYIVLVTGTLALVAGICDPAYPQAGFDGLLCFAALAFLFGCGQRAKRRRQIKRGLVSHSYYIGTSIFDFRWLPAFCRRNRRMSRFADPLFCLTIGLLLLPVSMALGCWIIFAGLCVNAYEQAVANNEFNISLDMLDGVIASDNQGANFENFNQLAEAKRQKAQAVPTGIGPDIQQRIKRRKP